MPEANGRPAFCLVLHGVAPATWLRFRDFVARVDRLGPVPLTLLVVPDYHGGGTFEHDQAFLAILHERLARGDELALHGYYHADAGAFWLTAIDKLLGQRVASTKSDWLARQA